MSAGTLFQPEPCKNEISLDPCQTRVKCEGKLTNLVIGRGNMIDFVAQEVIDRLYWPTEKLLKPYNYKVTWANDSIILVTH